ncbi:MAG TPA: hypothetical protein VJ873_11045, partial [bacterium]|nr:hypothetical protein [bacterium]
MKQLVFVFSVILISLGFLAGCPGNNNPASPGFSGPTNTFTITNTPCTDGLGHTCTPTCTSTPTNSPTITSTPTVTNTPTPAVTYVSHWNASSPVGAAVDPTNNNIVISNKNSNCLEIFTSAGSPVTTYCASGTMLGQFNQPVGVAVDQSGNIYVVDTGNNRVEVFNSALSCT